MVFAAAKPSARAQHIRRHCKEFHDLEADEEEKIVAIIDDEGSSKTVAYRIEKHRLKVSLRRQRVTHR